MEMKHMLTIANIYCFFIILIKSSCSHGQTCEKNFIPYNDVTDAVIASFRTYKPAKVGDKIKNTGFTIIAVETVTYRKYDQLVLVAEKGPTTIVAFRGTKHKIRLYQYVKDFLSHATDKESRTDLSFNNKEVSVLKFFGEAANLLYPKIRSHLMDKTRKYIITGHSLGGALASIISIKLKAEKTGAWENPGSCMISFGAPRVGDKRYADLHDEMIPFYRKLRFTRHSDAVPSLPPRGMFMHHSREVYLQRKRKLTWGGIKSRYEIRICPKGDNHVCLDKDLHIGINMPKTALLYLLRGMSSHSSYEKFLTSSRPRVYRDVMNKQKPSWEDDWDSSCPAA